MTMKNHPESQVENFKYFGAAVPASLAVAALVERYFDGWDASDIEAAASQDFDPTSTEDWDDLADSPAWGYAPELAIIAGIRAYAKEAR